MDISDKIEFEMKERGVSRYKLSKETGIPYTTLTQILNGRTENPQVKALQIIADYFGKPLDYFTGSSPLNESKQAANDPYALTPKDERDIAKQLEQMKESLESNMALSFHGEPIDDEDREALLASLENTLRLSKYMAKKKFTPNKYRKDT